MRSFKSNENIHKKEGGSYYVVSANKASSVTLQYKALLLVFNDFNSSYEALLEKVKMPTLYISRSRVIAMETFKILHKLTSVYLQALVAYKKSAY